MTPAAEVALKLVELALGSGGAVWASVLCWRALRRTKLAEARLREAEAREREEALRRSEMDNPIWIRERHAQVRKAEIDTMQSEVGVARSAMEFVAQLESKLKDLLSKVMAAEATAAAAIAQHDSCERELRKVKEDQQRMLERLEEVERNQKERISHEHTGGTMIAGAIVGGVITWALATGHVSTVIAALLQ